jgi:hypothetical protein
MKPRLIFKTDVKNPSYNEGLRMCGLYIKTMGSKYAKTLKSIALNPTRVASASAMIAAVNAVNATGGVIDPTAE